MNLFDGLRDNAAAIVAHNMGYIATWNPADHSSQQTAEVLYSDNTEHFSQLGDDVEFEMFDFLINYHYNKLVGLKASVDNGTKEAISIALPGGTVNFYVAKVGAKKDGATFLAGLTKKKT